MSFPYLDRTRKKSNATKNIHPAICFMSLTVLIIFEIHQSVPPMAEAQIDGGDDDKEEEEELKKMTLTDISNILEQEKKAEKLETLKKIILSDFLNNIEILEHTTIQQALVASNEDFKKFDMLSTIIDQRDKEWKSSEPDEITPFMDSLINNSVSGFLRQSVIELNNENDDFSIEEVILTNSYGVNIGQTGKTSDYKQSDEQWWQVAKDHGSYFESGFDESIGVKSLDLSVRIPDKDGKFLGVIKFVFTNDLYPIDYEVGVLLIDIGKIDLSIGSYDLAFWFSMSSEDVDFTKIPPPEIDFVNGRIDDTILEFVEPHFVTYKVYGTFYNDMDFTNYPFSTIDLVVVIEANMDSPKERVILHVDPEFSNIDLEAHIPGWILTDTNYTIEDHEYSGFGTFSKYSAIYSLQTPFLASFMTGIFPIMIMGSVGLMLFGFNPTDHGIRGQVIVGLLIGAIFFHILDIGWALPPLDYLTLQDKLMSILYISLVVIFAEVPIQRKFNEKDNYNKSKEINHKMRMYVMPVVLGIAVVIIFLVM